jgi:hypothetical protein
VCHILKNRTEEELQVEELQVEEHNAVIDAKLKVESNIEPSHSEPNLILPSTETIDLDSTEDDKDLESFKKNLMKSLTKSENTTKLNIVENEVSQYIEEGYVKGAWSNEDIALLKRYYPTKGRKYCSTKLNRNESSIQKKINALGIKKRKKRK